MAARPRRPPRPARRRVIAAPGEARRPADARARIDAGDRAVHRCVHLHRLEHRHRLAGAPAPPSATDVDQRARQRRGAQRHQSPAPLDRRASAVGRAPRRPGRRAAAADAWRGRGGSSRCRSMKRVPVPRCRGGSWASTASAEAGRGWSRRRSIWNSRSARCASARVGGSARRTVRDDHLGEQRVEGGADAHSRPNSPRCRRARPADRLEGAQRRPRLCAPPASIVSAFTRSWIGVAARAGGRVRSAGRRRAGGDATICARTRSTPVTASVTVCSTCRPQVGLENTKRLALALDVESSGARLWSTRRALESATGDRPCAAQAQPGGEGAISISFWCRRCRLRALPRWAIVPAASPTTWTSTWRTSPSSRRSTKSPLSSLPNCSARLRRNASVVDLVRRARCACRARHRRPPFDEHRRAPPAARRKACARPRASPRRRCRRSATRRRR